MKTGSDKSLNFLFIVPKYAAKGSFYFFPIGMGYVIAYMRSKGFNVHCVNLCHSDDSIVGQITPIIEEKQIDVVCTGAMTMHWNLIKDVLLTVKENFPDKLIVLGGSIITSEPEIAMESFPADFGIIGEGEITMAELAAELCGDNFQPECVDGVIFRNKSGEFVKTKERLPIMDLDMLPIPAYDIMGFDKFLEIRWNKLPSLNGITFDIDENQRLGEILTSRSCPYSCTFCYHPLGNKYRQRSMDNVFKEIDYLKKTYNIRILNVLDELFSLKEDRIKEFCHRIKPYGINWSAQWRVDNANAELLQMLKDSGLIALGLGVESMSDKILKSMKKFTSKVQIEAAFKRTAELGIRTGGNIILGDINETDETMQESIEWFLSHPEYELNLAMIRSIPDSEIWRYTVDKGLIGDKKLYFENSMPLVNFSKLSKKAYSKCLNYVTADSWLHFTIRGKVIESELLPELFNGKEIYRFKIRCPLCNSISQYKHYSITTRHNTPVICKFCQKKLAVDTGKVFHKDYKLIIRSSINKIRFLYIFYLKPIFPFNVVANCAKKLFRIAGVNTEI